jgi:glycosyltransferase involved in cell wall biosynthesis
VKIAYDLRRIANVGIGRYMGTLVEAVTEAAPQHEYVLIMPPESNHLAHLPSCVQRVQAKSGYYSVSEQFELPAILKRLRVDLLHSPHFVVPLRKTCPTVATIHDVIHLVYPQDIQSRIGRFYARWMVQAAIRVADRIVTDSEFSKQDIIQRAGGNPDKIDVIYPFVERRLARVSDASVLQSTRNRYGIRREYILYMGIFRERKNHVGLLRAFARLIASGHDLDLVIAGPIDQAQTNLSTLAKDLGVLDRFVLLGFVPEGEIAALYSGAAIYACPSLYEGFGYTPLEAMACGVPVVCHNGTSLPEVCGEAAVYGDARDAEQFALALARVIEDRHLRVGMIQRGFMNLQRFSASKTVDATLDLYSELRPSDA